MFGAIIKAITGLIWLVLLMRKRTLLAARPRGPRVPRETLKLLDDVQPPTPQEIELYVPKSYRNLGPDWIFTRGKVLTFSETSKTRMVGSVAGFDVAREFEERYSVYRGIYGYRDHTRRVQTFTMPPTENDRIVRPGRSLIICFDRRSPRMHHLFSPVRTAHPMRRYDRF
jgi:hypothetical protein